MTCFGRSTETAELWRHFKAGRNLLMLAPRRIGKTVQINHLRDTAAEHGFRAIVLEVAGFREEKDFFRQCCATIQEELSTGAKVMTAFSERLSRMLRGQESGDWRQALLQTDWREFASHLLAHLDEHKNEPPWLILVDELPIFVLALRERGGIQAVSDFLYWLRNLRQKYRRVRWLYTGSIGMDSVARRDSVEGALNDLDVFPFAPFDPDTARAFLADIAQRRSCTLHEDAAEAILRRLGWLSPYYLEKVAEDACTLAGVRGALDLPRAQAALDRMLDLEKRTYWSTWREHLDRNFPEPERSRLYTVLETVAKSDAGVSRDAFLPALNRGGEPVGEAALRHLLDTLLADGYLAVDHERRYAFRMNLLREWWLRYVVL
ncbi:MAG TPA: hypothetical protein P5284_01590 [Candidatus Contendobacter sp.]|nr:hypothetical protein [Candidatus Contendobacter sp.]HRZ51847.1 hypothetical protein [Candidatus Contendobacter sp.]